MKKLIFLFLPFISLKAAYNDEREEQRYGANITQYRKWALPTTLAAGGVLRAGIGYMKHQDTTEAVHALASYMALSAIGAGFVAERDKEYKISHPHINTVKKGVFITTLGLGMATNDLSNIFLVGLGAAATAVGVEGIHYMAINGKEIAHKGYEILHHSKKTSNLLEIEDTPNQKKTT